MGRRKTKPTESSRPPPKEQVVQIIVSSEESATTPGQVVAGEPDGSRSAAGRIAGSSSDEADVEVSLPKAVVPVVLPPNEVIVTEDRGRTRTIVKSNYQTRRKSGVLKLTSKKVEDIFDEVVPLEEVVAEPLQQQGQEEPPVKRKKGRPRKVPLLKPETLPEDYEPLLRVNGIDCSQAMDPDSVEQPLSNQDDMRLVRKLHVLLADANSASSSEADRETTLKAKILLEQISNYKAKACKFSVETAIEYMKWFELNSRSYEFVRTMHGGGGLFTLPSAKTIRRYVDPFSESVQLTNLEAAQSTLILQQMHPTVGLASDQQTSSVNEHTSADDTGLFYVEDTTPSDSDFLVRIEGPTGEQLVSRPPPPKLTPDAAENQGQQADPARPELSPVGNPQHGH